MREPVLHNLVSKVGLYLKHHSSTILTCVGAIGVVGTAVLAAKATPKAVKLIEEATDEKGEDLTKVEIVKVAAPTYVPTVIVGASTLACIFGANILNQRQQAALISAYALADNTYKEYRGKLKELFGEEADVQIRKAIMEDRKNDVTAYAPGLGSIDISGDTMLFYEENKGKYFESTMTAVINAEYHFNRNFAMRGYADLNEFYEFLGLEPTEEGSVLGWSSSELLEGGLAPWVEFDHRLVTLEDGLECCLIEFPFPPIIDYESY